MIEKKHFRAHVLVVDDNPTDAMMLEGGLQIVDCTVDVADDKTINDAIKHSYDIIFLDINMPGDDGLTIADKIRRSDTPNRRTPIIAVSGNTFNQNQIIDCLENGLDGYLEKPPAMSELIKILCEFIPDKEVIIENISRDGEVRLKGFYRKQKKPNRLIE